jgi:hypothetical protein
MLVRPTVTYAAIAQWSRVKYKLLGPDMLTCLSITGTVRMIPTARTEALLGLHSYEDGYWSVGENLETKLQKTIKAQIHMI